MNKRSGSYHQFVHRFLTIFNLIKTKTQWCTFLSLLFFPRKWSRVKSDVIVRFHHQSKFNFIIFWSHFISRPPDSCFNIVIYALQTLGAGALNALGMWPSYRAAGKKPPGRAGAPIGNRVSVWLLKQSRSQRRQNQCERKWITEISRSSVQST